MSRKTITIPEEVFEEAKAHKGDRSWAEVVLAGAKPDGQEDEGQPERQAVPEDILTEDHIPDIGGEVERRLERVLENHTTRP
jgi:hypothetical protein